MYKMLSTYICVRYFLSLSKMFVSCMYIVVRVLLQLMSRKCWHLVVVSQGKNDQNNTTKNLLE